MDKSDFSVKLHPYSASACILDCSTVLYWLVQSPLANKGDMDWIIDLVKSRTTSCLHAVCWTSLIVKLMSPKITKLYLLFLEISGIQLVGFVYLIYSLFFNALSLKLRQYWDSYLGGTLCQGCRMSTVNGPNIMIFLTFIL